MNRKITSLLVAVFIAVGFALAQEGGDASAKIQQLEQEMNQAQMNNDSAWYEQHLADGYVEGHSWGDWANKAEAIKQMKDVKHNKGGEVSDLKVIMFDPNVAVAHYRATYDATFSGTHRARTVICSDTWVNQSGAWKLASDHCSHVEGK